MKIFEYKLKYALGYINCVLDDTFRFIKVDFLNKHTSSQGPSLKECEPIAQYFQGKTKKINVRYVFPQTATNHQVTVWNEIAHIPYGQTATYGDIAKAIGSSPRAVGGACGANHLPIIIPCHRVVSSKDIGGFANNLSIKRFLLQLEKDVSCGRQG